MKYSIGYSISCDNSYDFVDIVRRYKNHIAEVYFPWPYMPSGRGLLVSCEGYIDWSLQDKLLSDLRKIKDLGIKLNLLLNGNCYGSDAIGITLQNNIMSVIDYLNYLDLGVESITTASLSVAYVIKKHYPKIDIRASVNMRIGTVKAMQYISDLFDSYYMQRDYNRELDRIKILKKWADENGKKLYMLANSGCMSFCSAQTFHDNAVSHSNEIAAKQNIEGFCTSICHTYLKKEDNWVSLLQNTWIRPEDIHNYEGLFDTVKLATRMHMLPAMVIDSYVRQHYYGNLLDIFEPGYGMDLMPYIIDNTRFPDDWFEYTSKCNKQCENCNYCGEVLKKVLIKDESE